MPILDLLRQGWDALASVPYLRLYLTLGWALYLLLLGGWIILQKREPVATVSWLLGLALLPYVGFLIYHVFGPQRIERQRLRRARVRGELPAQSLAENEDVAELARMVRSATGLPMTTASSLRLLVDALGAARCQRFFGSLVEAGGELAWFHPTRFGRIWQRPWTNLRSHRKIVVIDGRVGYTGGMNVTDDQNERVNAAAYRDLHLRVEGNVVRALQLVFVEDWAYATGERDFIGDVVRQTPRLPAGGTCAQVITSGPDSPWEAIHRAHVGAIHAARERVWLVTPYFVPGEAAMMSLTSTVLAGLDVRLVVPRMSDSRLVTFAARSYFGPLLQAGVKVYEYGPRMLHTKALLVDQSTVLIGSANFDHRSFRLNFEVSVLFEDAEMGAALAQLIEGELASAPRVRPGRQRWLLTARLPEALARLLSPVL